MSFIGHVPYWILIGQVVIEPPCFYVIILFPFVLYPCHALDMSGGRKVATRNFVHHDEIW